MEVLGWHTLNSLGLTVDYRINKLVPMADALALTAA
jgi:hypothetical protein